MPAETYILLDVPDPVRKAVLAIRRRSRHIMRADYPVAVGGVGPVASGQMLAEITRAVREVAADTAPITTTFAQIVRLRGTNMLYVKAGSQRPFNTIASRLKKAGVRLDRGPWGSVPRLTIGWFDDNAGEELARLRKVELPTKPVTMKTLTVYQLLPSGVAVLHREKLRG